jgi:predicted dehydrogenase
MTKFIKSLFLVCFVAVAFVGCNGGQTAQRTSFLIPTETPARPAGQTHVVGLAVDPIETVRVGVIGLGMRGPGAVQRLMHIEGVEIVALCDLHLDRVERTQRILVNAGRPEAATYYGPDGWRELVRRDDLDLIYIAADWRLRGEMIVYAVENGKHVATEHPGAVTMEELWNIVNAAEKHRKHVFLLANVVYNGFELTTLNMIQQGVFGKILYAEGAYIHKLEEFWDRYEGDWRIIENRRLRGDIYPIHGIGSAALALNINRGDRMTHLVSMDTRPVSIPNWLNRTRGENLSHTHEDFANGQNTMTLIQTENGRAINLHRDVASPRPYSRMYAVQGTYGYLQMWPTRPRAEAPLRGYGMSMVGHKLYELTGNPELAGSDGHDWLPVELTNSLLEMFQHPILTDEMQETARQLGPIAHGGMDFIMDFRLIYALRNGLPLDMDVYDLAAWSSIVPLTAVSLENGNAPVEIPDFTRGYWNLRQGVHFYLSTD